MAIYDLLFKFEGVKALCGMSDDLIGTVLFPVHGDQERRSNLSRLKSGEHSLRPEQKIALTAEVNLGIDRLLKAKGNEPLTVLRAEDWDKPVHEFFRHIANRVEEPAPEALDRAHAAIMQTIEGFARYRAKTHALLVERYNPKDQELYRIPVSAVAVDPFDLPPVPLNVAEQMVVRLTRPVNDWPARAWLFYVRNPDERSANTILDHAWDQNLSDFLFWHLGGPFEVPAKFVGVLPGFPDEVSARTGAVTAFLMLEPLASNAVATLLSRPTPGWRSDTTPSFEGVAHMLTCDQRLFQRGNTLKLEKGQLTYPPPILLVRRYKVGH